MIGLPFNPDNCLFVANQAFNSNQFNGSVPNSSNTSNHTVLWDFIDNKLYWVNTLTNIIEREISGATGIQNEAYQIESTAYMLPPDEAYFYRYLIQDTDYKVIGNNYILLPAGTYTFELEFDVVPLNSLVDEGNYLPLNIQIRTNTNQALTLVDASDVVQSFDRINLAREMGARQYPLVPKFELDGNPFDMCDQTCCTGPVTFNAPFIVKSAFSIYNPQGLSAPSTAINFIQLRALLVK